MVLLMIWYECSTMVHYVLSSAPGGLTSAATVLEKRKQAKGAACFFRHHIGIPRNNIGTIGDPTIIDPSYQWPSQEPKLEVPTIYKAYIRPM